VNKPPLFDRTKRWLRKEYPLPYRVTVRRVEDDRLEGMWGVCEIGEDSVFIAIRRSLSQPHASETLIEEWAHALRETLAIKVPYEIEPHDGHFWLVYGEIVTKWRAKFA